MMHNQGFKAEVRRFPPISTQKFDTIIALELIEHLDEEDRFKLIEEAKTLCNKAIFSVPNNCMPPEEILEHRIMFNKESFEYFLKKVFTNVEINVVNNYLVGICE